MQLIPCVYRGSHRCIILNKCRKAHETSLQIHSKIDDVITLRDVSRLLKSPKYREYVPIKYYDKNLSQETLKHLRWMVQKDILGQDMFLIGAPGSRRRNLAMIFSELTEREVEFISLSHDTTEADLKQRREIENRTAIYHDQSALKAAINGRVLILEGIEKAERNVLPVLNNLFENREMHLEDGRFLIPPERYDKLLRDHGHKKMAEWKLERVSEAFRVIALGLPVPRYPGYPLDPPLRSRFQARYIQPMSYQHYFSHSGRMLDEENTRMSERTLNAESLIAEGFEEFEKKSWTFPITNDLMKLDRGARSSYELYLENEKKKTEDQAKKIKSDLELGEKNKKALENMKSEVRSIEGLEKEVKNARVDYKAALDVDRIQEMLSDATKKQPSFPIIREITKILETLREKEKRLRAKLDKLTCELEKRNSKVVRDFVMKKKTS